ncbi:MAG: hypothetical protein BWX84_01366 [Verrucomicrobia bacterium ADurb.Bin118]|nr:MAG: hypothetical protein BWX84_01366 [Verrucomicrobia bacterium ADurb.Bin118]
MGGEGFLGRDDRLHGLQAEFQRGIEISFGDFLGRAFKHDDLGFAAHEDEVQIAVLQFAVRGVDDELARDPADAHGAERSGPRNITDHQRGGRAVDAEDVRVILAVGAEHDGLDLDFVVPAFGEERTDRAIRHAHGEDFLFGGAPFALEVAAREFARRGGFLPVIHGQGKEILAFPGFGGGHGGHNDHGFAELNRDGAVRLFGELAGFDDELSFAGTGSDLGLHDLVLPPLLPRNFSESRKAFGTE